MKVLFIEVQVIIMIHWTLNNSIDILEQIKIKWKKE
jgi:hypothetical protein